MPADIRFGQLVKDRRSAIGLTQAELANRVGCAPITIRKIEADTLRPSFQMAERLALALNIPEAEQLGFVRLSRQKKPSTPVPKPTPTPSEIGLADLSGRAVKGFQLGELIGSGGFGMVYKAIQPSVNREVAVKIILPKFANQPEFIRRFESEAQLVARLEHPHIVPLYDYWREPDAAYLILRLLKGGSLGERLHQGGLALADSLRLMQQVGLALDVAHRNGVIHRDIKPANVMLDESDNAYLTDFGIAKNLERGAGQTPQGGVVVGSPAYISPEQILAEPVQPQSDIYCFGILLFETITGEKPFKGPTPVAFIQQHLNERLPSLLDHVPEAPVQLDEVIQKATEKKPEKRYQTILELLSDLERIAAAGRQSGLLPASMQPAPLSTQEIAALENPFLGLRPFTEADAENFYGRNALIQELLGMMADDTDLTRFVAVVGPSGSGKSSVVKAGLIPALRRGGLPASENWFIAQLTPSSYPWEELEAALLRIAADPPENLAQQLMANERGLLRTVPHLLPDDKETELLLVIDQFEELFTLVEDEEVRTLFLDSLVTAVLDPRSRLRVVLTLRADFTDRPLQYADFGELMRQRMAFVLPLIPQELTDAITQPINRLGLEMEPALVTTIVQDVGDQPGMLPLLQYTLTELFERRNDRLLTLADYQAAGGVTETLAHRADEIFERLDARSQEASRQLFLRLITLGEGIEDTRRRVLLTEVESLSSQSPISLSDAALENPLSKIINEYGHYRLLTFDHDPVTRGATVEVAHEALLREWPRLRSWLADSRKDVRRQQEVAGAAAQWEVAGQDASYLLRGSRLTQFEAWLENTAVALTTNERTFLDQSIAARDQRQAEEAARQQRELEAAQRLADEQTQAARRLRQFVMGLAFLLIIAMGATWFALVQRNTAQENFVDSERIRLASQAQNALDRGEEGNIPALLALRSLQLGYSIEADAALHTALQRGLSRQQYLGHVASVYIGNFSPDGRFIVTGDDDGTVRLWHTQTGQEIRQFIGHTNLVNSVMFSPDGRHILTAGIDNTARLWDVESGEEVRRITGLGAIWSARYSPDGQYIAVAEDSDISLWDISSGQEIWRADGHTGTIFYSDFSLDGRFLATASNDGTARLWDVLSGKELRQFTGHAEYLSNATISPDGRFLLTTSGDRTLRLWDIETGAELRRFVGHSDIVISGWFSPNGRTILSSGHDGTARLWDVQTGQELRRIVGHTGVVRTVFSPDGRNFLTVGEDRSVRLWETTAVNEPQTALNYGPGHAAFLTGVIIAPDGRSVLTGQNGGLIQEWDIVTGEERLQFNRDSATLITLAFSPIQQLVLSGDESGLLSIWDLETGQVVQQLEATRHSVRHAIFTPNGEKVLTSGEGYSVRLWDIATSKEQRQFVGHNDVVQAMAFSIDGQIMLTGSDDETAILWEANSGQQRQQFIGHNGSVLAVAIGPDGQTILTGGADNNAIIWDAESGEKLFELIGHTDQVTHVSFSPNGQYALTGSADQSARLWDIGSGELLRQYSGHDSPLQHAIFSEDGRQIFTADNRSVYIWRTTLADTVAFACEQLSRDFTTEERAFYSISDDNPTCPMIGQQIAQAEPVWTPIAPDDFEPEPISLVTEFEFINAEPAMVSMAMPMQWIYVSSGEDEIIRLEEIDEEKLDMPIYSSKDLVPTDLQAPFEIGPFPKGEPLGLTLREYVAAGGRGTYTLQGRRALVDLTFYNLIPNGVYTLWCVMYTTIPAPETLLEAPCGAPDGSENIFIADSEGNGRISLEMDAFPPSTPEGIYEFAIAYHSDGQTHGEVVGEYGKNVHIQLLYDFLPLGQ